jgi:hypothetical protein
MFWPGISARSSVRLGTVTVARLGFGGFGIAGQHGGKDNTPRNNLSMDILRTSTVPQR